MGTYATTTSFTTLMIGVTLDSATTSLISKCITWGENEINKKLARRYDVSAFQTTVPPQITSICETLAMGYYYENSSRGSGKDAFERADRLIKRAGENLNDLAAGRLELVDSSGDIISPRSTVKGVLSTTNDYTSTFGEDDPLDWKIDPDKLDDISSDRD